MLVHIAEIINGSNGIPILNSGITAKISGKTDRTQDQF